MIVQLHQLDANVLPLQEGLDSFGGNIVHDGKLWLEDLLETKALILLYNPKTLRNAAEGKIPKSIENLNIHITNTEWVGEIIEDYSFQPIPKT